MFSWPANYDFCYTLAGVISKEGIGLHSGEKTRVTISPYEKEGYYVSFKDKPGEIFKLTQDLIGSTMLCTCLLYTSPSPRDTDKSRMPSSA